jgi:hypothetical protein
MRFARFALVLIGLISVTSVPAQTLQQITRIRVLSSPNMVSGGDALIQIVLSGPGRLLVTANARDVSGAFKATSVPNTYLGLVKDLPLGRSEILAGFNGVKPSGQLDIFNHPLSGPIFSGPHQVPFVCETEVWSLGVAKDSTCSAPTRVTYFYRSSTDQQTPVKPYDPNGPKPTDIATTTTLDGKTVPYIVYREDGVIDRAVYTITFLHEPGTPLPDPWNQSNGAWNGRMIYSFGAGCVAGYHQGRAIGGLVGNRRLLEETQLGDYGIAKGYAVVSSSLNSFSTSCNDVTAAESMMMVKEYFTEKFGPPLYTIGSGRSGGSMQQHLIANNYPGLLEGIIPTAAFADTITFMHQLYDCELLGNAFDKSSLKWTEEQRGAVAGHQNWDYCQNNGANFPILRLRNCDQTALKPEMIYDPKQNPKGARCNYQDNMVNVFGRDPKTGFARSPFDNVGIQYGLKALNDGKISFEQFVDLNTRIGGHDLDDRLVGQRAVADPEALGLAYRTGRVNQTGMGMATIPIIDARPYTDGTGDVHDAVNSHITRARLIAANGTSANQVLHTYEPGTPIQRVQATNLDQMDQWLANISKDKAPARTPLEKVIRNKPANVTDACYTKEGQAITDMKRCAEMFPVFSNTRLAAGQPIAAAMLKCQMKPVDRKDYSKPLSDEQFSKLKTVFSTGVCDYSKKSVGAAAPTVWLSYK